MIEFFSRITPIKTENNFFIVLRDKLNHLLRFKADLAIDCDTPGECFFTNAMKEISEVISDRDHDQTALIVGFGKDYEGVEGWYPKAFQKFENNSSATFTETMPLLQFQKTISSVIGEEEKKKFVENKILFLILF